MEDIAPIKAKAFESNISQLISQKQGTTDCLHDSIKTKTIPDSVFRTINVLDSVNKFIKIQKKNKVIFKVIGGGKGTATSDDKDGDGFKDKDDKCPDVKGTVRGCLDTDGDGFTDDVEDCDDSPGNCDGCTDIVNLNVQYNANDGILSWGFFQNCNNFKIKIIGNAPKEKIETRVITTEGNSFKINDIRSSVWNKHMNHITILVQPIMDKKYNLKCVQGNVCTPEKLYCDKK
jgi:hypothetical protein